MQTTINQPQTFSQDQFEEIESFALFTFPYKPGKGIKARIKSSGCNWNPLHHGWLCPIAKQEEVIKAIQAANLDYTNRPVKLPKGMISKDPKIAGLRSYLDILEKQSYEEDRKFLQDVYSYDPLLRPEDFILPPLEEGKNTRQILQEKDFHERWAISQKKKEEIEQCRKELSRLSTESEEKIFDSNAPLVISLALIQEHFLFEDERTLQYCSDAFWRWDGIKYNEFTEDAMRQVIYKFLENAKKPNDSGNLKNFNPNKLKVDQVIDALHALCYQICHPAHGAIWLDGRKEPNPKHLISFQNGLLNIKDWIANPLTPLIPHSPLFLNVNSLTFSFDPNASIPDEWIQFLNNLWPEDLESQETLQEWTGYLLIQDTRLHKILLIVGPPRAGKGTIGRVIQELLGAFNTIGPTLSSLREQFGLQPFLNKTLALISDVRLNGKGNNNIVIERLLCISGEDSLTINRKFLPPITVKLPTRIIMMSNELPDMQDASGALATRYIVLTLQKSWLGNEDPELSSRLCNELPGVLLWALQGLARLQKRGKLIQPTSSNQTIEELESITSPIKAFIREKCEVQDQSRVEVDDLFSAWQTWCNFNGHPHIGDKPSFGKKLRAAFPSIERIKPQKDSIRDNYYVGIKLIST